MVRRACRSSQCPRIRFGDRAHDEPLRLSSVGVADQQLPATPLAEKSHRGKLGIELCLSCELGEAVRLEHPLLLAAADDRQQPAPA